MLIQYILTLIIALIIWQSAIKYRRGDLSMREFLFWLFLWIVAGAVVLLPQATSFLAEYLGVGRGADLAIYAGLILIFYLIFRLFAKQEKIEKDISKIVEHLAKTEWRGKK